MSQEPAAAPAATPAAPAPRGTLRIGLTGPIGCGKSTVARWLADLGVVVIDADQVAHDVVAAGQPTLEAVIARFGEAYRAADGGLDRAALGRRVFASPADLAALEAIVHPAVRPRILAAIAAAEASDAPAVAVEAIKLVEGGLAGLCDEVWLITCLRTEQRTRLRGRGMTDPEAARRIAAQGDLEARLTARATRVIDTSGSSAGARGRVEEALLGALRVDDDIPSVAEFRVWARQVHNAAHGVPVNGPGVEEMQAAAARLYGPIEDARARAPTGDSTASEILVRFLEADPWCQGSGYEKVDAIRALCRARLSEPVRERLRRVVLAAVDGRDRREFRAYVRLARAVDSPSLRDELRSRLAAHEAIRRHAKWVLEGVGERV